MFHFGQNDGRKEKHSVGTQVKYILSVTSPAINIFAKEYEDRAHHTYMA